MKNIVNLVKLNFINLYSLKKTFIVVVLFGTVFGVIQPQMISFAGAMYLMIVCYSQSAYEERSKMNYLIASLPVTKKQYIAGKYIFALLNGLIAMCLTVLLSYVIPIINPSAEAIPTNIICITILALCIFIVSVSLPLTLIFGVEKGRYFLIFIAVLPICFGPTIMASFPKPDFTFLVNMTNSTLILLGTLASITILLASYFITSNIYSKKEVY